MSTATTTIHAANPVGRGGSEQQRRHTTRQMSLPVDIPIRSTSSSSTSTTAAKSSGSPGLVRRNADMTAAHALRSLSISGPSSSSASSSSVASSAASSVGVGVSAKAAAPAYKSSAPINISIPHSISTNAEAIHEAMYTFMPTSPTSPRRGSLQYQESLSTSLPTFRTQQGPSGFPLFPAPGSAPMMRRPSLPPTPLTSTTAGSPEAPPSAPPTTTGGIFKFDPFVMQPSPGLFSRKRAFSVPAVPAYTDGSHPTPASSLAQIPERPSIEKDPINNMALHGQFMDFC
ncbi:hypothetical protein CAOG_08623 [Capsaspora owczarzaki ATCC 30864]|uniref:Uncharacterized protein n=1 Tax=Capsaspora owczarzaki (strain ATCC 30864) TaxID=595528 RepID=A0A0D2U8V4_CAPO3|nr:hypothetical protein CAOG_08623 [Capsaspora owczarzaki ATCC 30864]KJE91501.1 hypothetical protein CAOG_008623 [Capsaspora owczarzaki ATCC 30864]|eukprot:XP_011270223.1 hypothetical protein CAOG_08623 [Capsaspora owczarzaki ATCC 30864]